MIRRLGNRTRGIPNSFRSTVDVLAGAPTELTYASNGDTNSVFYYIGTNGLREAWTNPHTAGRITVSANPALIQGTIEQLVDRTDNTVHSGLDASGNYFRFDLGASRTLVLKSFGFRQRADNTGTQANALYLYVSNNGTTWYLLNTIATASRAIQTYNLTTGTLSLWNSVAVAAPGAYRYIQFHAVTNNSASGYITASEIELYGTLYQS